MGSSSRSYLLTSATARLPVHTPTKSDRNLSDHVMFSLRDRRVVRSVPEIVPKSPFLSTEAPPGMRDDRASEVT